MLLSKILLSPKLNNIKEMEEKNKINSTSAPHKSTKGFRAQFPIKQKTVESLIFGKRDIKERKLAVSHDGI